MVCPIHDEKLIKNEIRKARITLGLPPDGPELRDKGVPKLGGTNR